MGDIDQTQRLVRSIVRLRQAELAGAGDFAAEVREDLEEVVGPSLSRAESARLLGVTQTALDRHIMRGAIPVVVTPYGRHEIPLLELVRLLAEVLTIKEHGGTARPLSAALKARRKRAITLDRATITTPPPRSEGRAGGELHGLAYHRAVAARLDRQMVVDARRRLARWRRLGRVDPRWAEKWEQILSLLPRATAAAIVVDSRTGYDLRQSSPFAGALEHEERKRVLELVASVS
jgi:hypothetical protein